jgi:lipopolysaccharide/colanic/teichoic acid biosynthesis glycosyltransferase
MERVMSLMTHTQTVLPVVLHRAARTQAVRPRQPETVPSTHIAMIKRFATIAMALVAIALAVAAVVAVKLAIYWPRFV